MNLTFTHHIPHPNADELVAAEIGYRIEDAGVMGRKDEKLVATITAAIWRGQDLVGDLDAALRSRLEDEAFAHWQDQLDLQRFGGEAI